MGRSILALALFCLALLMGVLGGIFALLAWALNSLATGPAIVGHWALAQSAGLALKVRQVAQRA